MVTYLIRRSLLALVVIVGVSMATFVIMDILPGDFYTRFALNASQETLDLMRAEYGLDKPWIVQYWTWFSQIVTKGTLGYSLRYGRRPVEDVLFGPSGPAWMSLLICGTSVLLAWVVSVPLGVSAATRWGRPVRYAVAVLGYPLLALPGFFTGIVVQWFVYRFVDPMMVGKGLWGICGWEFVGQPMSWAKFVSCVERLSPLWVVIGVPVLVTLTRVLGDSMRLEMTQKYIVVARGKGLSEIPIRLKHALRNSLNPYVSTVSVLLPMVITHDILVAHVFGIESMGGALKTGVEFQDPHLFGGVTLVYAAILILGTFASDIVLALSDPRIRAD